MNFFYPYPDEGLITPWKKNSFNRYLLCSQISWATKSWKLGGYLVKYFYNSCLDICFWLLSATKPDGPSVTGGVSKSQQGMNSPSPSHVPASYGIKTLSHEAGDVASNPFREHMNLWPSLLMASKCCNMGLYGNSQLQPDSSFDLDPPLIS